MHLTGKRHQRSLVPGDILDLCNVFGEVHHHLLPVVLRFHHMPDSVVQLIDSNLYQDFRMTVVTNSYSTRILHVGKGVLQGNCLSPLLFNLLVNNFIRYIQSETFTQL